MPIETFADVALDPPVRGFVHRPSQPNREGLVLTHGAGSNCHAPLLLAVAEAFTDAGFTVLRCDLPYRQERRFGPPRPGSALRDRQGLKNAVACLRRLAVGRAFLGGHSYGGRQSSMLAAEEPGLVDGLILFSYPLHPPHKPAQLRIEHLPKLPAPALFVHGTHDPFGTVEELKSALKTVSGRTALLVIENSGHDLGFKGKSRREGLGGQVLECFQNLF